jgi:hypothetical protein
MPHSRKCKTNPALLTPNLKKPKALPNAAGPRTRNNEPDSNPFRTRFEPIWARIEPNF